MIQKIIIFFLLAGTLLGSEVNLVSPSATVQSYYNAINEGDIDALKQIMVKESFDTTIEVWALSKALNDKEFSKTLKAYGSSAKIDKKVMEAVRDKLLKTAPKKISELVSTPLGKTRCIIRYKEDGKNKQLFTSLHGSAWKIDYKAGRKLD